jgi:hypothetical protein
MRKTRKKTTTKRGRVFTVKHYNSGDGMLTSIWGPGMWHFLHTMSFNYPMEPTQKQKQTFKDFILSLVYVLPCKHCRDNLQKNLKICPLTNNHLKNRDTFSRYIYNLHEIVNNLLKKKSGLSYCDVRERYEHFRARCTVDQPEKIESGCTEPLYGQKAKSLIKIVPQSLKEDTLTIDVQCIKSKPT